MQACDGQSERGEIPRFVPEKPFPPYFYVTGRFPHPIGDPAGHSFGVQPIPCEAPGADRWRECCAYVFGLDLFNHGYYWEAHEVWEGIWHACGRSGLGANFIQGLIELAAAGVKAGEGRTAGVVRHARRAAELIGQVAERLPLGQVRYFGLSLPRLIGIAADLARGAVALPALTGAGVPVRVGAVRCGATRIAMTGGEQLRLVNSVRH